MPAKNPRLSVVLSPALASTLAALSEETGESASSLVRGFLEQAHFGLQRMLELVRAAKSAKGQIGEGVGRALDRVVTDLEDALIVADARSAQAVRDMVEEAEAVRGRRRRRGAPGASPAPQAPRNPRGSNRGVRSSGKTRGEGSGKPRKGV
jgi:hypothetical protein